MPRGYRYIVCALLGWLVLAAAAPEGTDRAREQDQTAREIANSLSGIDASLKKAGEPDVTTQPCGEREQKRDSDLCAQWKAADAAESSSNAAWLFGIVGSLIGAITMYAAIRAALYARDAAREAKRGSDAAEKGLAHAQNISAMELRPYLFIERIETCEIYSREYQVTIWFKNFGHTPARNIEVRSLCYVTSDRSDLRAIKKTHDIVEAGVAAPGHTRRSFDAVRISADDLEAFQEGARWVILRVQYGYTDDVGTEFKERFDYYASSAGVVDESPTFYLLTDGFVRRTKRWQRSLKLNVAKRERTRKSAPPEEGDVPF